MSLAVILVILVVVVALGAKAGATLFGKAGDTSLRPGEVEKILRGD